MSDLLKRSFSSILFVVLILGPLFLPDTRYAFGLYAMLGAFTLREILQITDRASNVSKTLSFGMYVIAVLGIYGGLYIEAFHWNAIYLSLLALAVISIVFELSQTQSHPQQAVANRIWTPLFTAMSFLGIFYFLSYRTDLPSLWLTIGLFLLIWINDSGAYLVGRKLGRTKLFERLSPKKTWEGSIGGLLLAMLAAFGLSQVSGMPSAAIMLGFGATCVLFGSLGDLFESRIKRDAGIKDSGVFLPGHGGFFDRFDAMMLAVPASILYFELVLPKP